MKSILIFLFLIMTTLVYSQELKKLEVKPALKIKKVNINAKNTKKLEEKEKGHRSSATMVTDVALQHRPEDLKKSNVALQHRPEDLKKSNVALQHRPKEMKKSADLKEGEKPLKADGEKLEEKIEEKYKSNFFMINPNKKRTETFGNYYLKGSLPLPKDFTVEDVPNDGGGVIEIKWKYHTDNQPELFELLRKSSKETKFKKVKSFDTTSIKFSFLDKTNKEWELYQYQIQVNGKPLKKNGVIVLAEPKLNKRKEMAVEWKYPVKDLPKEFTIARRTVIKDKASIDAYKKIGVLKSSKNVSYTYRDSSLKDELTYSYKIRVKKEGLYTDTKPKDMKPEIAWFDMNKLVMLLAGIFLVLAIVFFIRMARTGKELYIRRIAGLDAVDDAVGRATEMGREIMFVPGITDIDDPQTIAGLTILGRVAKLTAQYKTPLSVPVSKSMVMITGREIVKESYLSAGRPENFQDSMIYYLTDDQFGFAAGVDGIMVREKPATIFLQGAFYAESLILAETGHHIGAIQISGTAAPSQLPFFITACDYTLMGEELYAASAYLSREPQLLGSLRGQDAGKAVILLAIVAGIILETASFVFDMPGLSIKHYFNIK